MKIFRPIFFLIAFILGYASLDEASVDHKIDPDVSDRLEQKIDYLIERIEMMT